MIKLAIVIPAHNEEKRIGRTLDHYLAYFSELKKREMLDFEIIVVLNACKDNTREVVDKYKHREIFVLEFDIAAKGFAVVEGFKDALKRNNDVIGFVDADMATPPSAFHSLVKGLEHWQHGGIIAARWRRESEIKGQTVFFNLKSFIFNLIVSFLFLFPYSDTQCGAKLFRREAVIYVQDKMRITKWAFDIDLLYKLRRGGFSVIEIPTVWNSQDDSKLNVIKATVEMLLAVFRLRLVHSPFSFVVRAYDALPKRLKVHHRIWK